jgi:proton glutamate symport protein
MSPSPPGEGGLGRGLLAGLFLSGVVLAAFGMGLSQASLALAGRLAALTAILVFGVRKRSLTTWILVAMALGAEIGHDLPDFAVSLRVLSDIFLRLIKTIIAPLLFGTLVVGIAGHPDLRQVGRMGLKALVYFEVVTTLALFIGLGAINLTRAGVGLKPPEAAPATEAQAQTQTGKDMLLHVFPENMAKAVAEGQILQVVVFSVLFGISLALLPEEKRRPLLSFCQSLSETMFRFTRIVMYFAPVAVGAAIAYTVGHMGFSILRNLLLLLVTFYLALAAFLLLVLLPVSLLARVPLGAFARAVAEPFSIAFATSSSEAALPLAMERMEGLGAPRSLVAFVMPTGYSFNLDGSTVYLSLATVFVAQAAGIPLSFSRELLIVFTLMLTSKGVAGVPRAGLVLLLGTAASFGLPEWPVLAILGIDQLMDMGRASMNVIGNCLATVVIARSEGVFTATEKAKAPEETPKGIEALS